MDNYTAMGLAEGFIESQNENQVIEAWQQQGSPKIRLGTKAQARVFLRRQ